jgi:hypothetical protein
MTGVLVSHTAGSFSDAATVLPLKAPAMSDAFLTAVPVVTYSFHYSMGGMASVTVRSTKTTRNITLTGGDFRTAMGLGSVVLVTPARADTGAAGILAIFGLQQLNFVPEPGTLLLLGSGVAGLGLLGRRKQKKS